MKLCRRLCFRVWELTIHVYEVLQFTIYLIVSFLAMLELVKQGLVRVNQEKHFEDISIESENLSVPRY